MKRYLTLIKSLIKDIQIKLFCEKKFITNDNITIPGTETIVTEVHLHSLVLHNCLLSEEGILKLARWGAIYPLRFMLYYTVPDCRKERYGEIIDLLSRNKWINYHAVHF